MFKGVFYHLPLKEASKIRIEPPERRKFSFRHAYEEIRRNGSIVQVREITDKEKLKAITDSAVELAAMARFLSGPRIR
jgi:hypothetical protein